jgi:D-glycero-D-manno-heptose 1,7-bisphosphate phosphatase
VFLDRDGCIIEDADYLTEVAQIQVLPGVPEALRLLRRAGYRLLVVTNQSAVARGWLTEQKLHVIHRALDERLAEAGVRLDAYYYCPHLAEVSGACNCRKPAPGMLKQAAAEWHVDTARSWMVGDSERDVQAGAAVGCRTILIGSGPTAAEATVGSLREAADIILAAH